MNSLYNACGNRILIHHPKTPTAIDQLKMDVAALTMLAQYALAENADSVMILTGDPDAISEKGYHVTMDVFEPNAFSVENPAHAWSTMCGNGVRAVAQYLEDTTPVTPPYLIHTGAGILRIEKRDNMWSVNMGEFVHDIARISHYAKRLPLSVDDFSLSYAQHYEHALRIGFHSQPGARIADGEPHVVLFRREPTTPEILQKETAQAGGIITTATSLFPQEINTSIACVTEVDLATKTVSVLAATYERNVYYITQACGTAATVIGALLFEQKELSDEWQICVSMPGGTLSITRANTLYFLTGPAFLENLPTSATTSAKATSDPAA